MNFLNTSYTLYYQQEKHMRDHLLDIVKNTYGLGIIDLVKVTGTATETSIEALSEDRAVIIQGKLNGPVAEFVGTFGMPNLGKLNTILGISEYKENAKISLSTQDRNGETVPTGLHFENAAGDFKNDYRFMSTDIINEKLKSVKFKGAQWNIEFQPSVTAIQKLKFQANANSEESVFQVSTDGDNLVFKFGDASSHAGEFIFQSGVTGKLKQTWSWPVIQVMSILNLPGDITMKIADVGAMMITVDSGIATYDYILPAQSK